MKKEVKELGEVITGNTPSRRDIKFWNSHDICCRHVSGNLLHHL